MKEAAAEKMKSCWSRRPEWGGEEGEDSSSRRKTYHPWPGAPITSNNMLRNNL